MTSFEFVPIPLFCPTPVDWGEVSDGNSCQYGEFVKSNEKAIMVRYATIRCGKVALAMEAAQAESAHIERDRSTASSPENNEWVAIQLSVIQEQARTAAEALEQYRSLGEEPLTRAGAFRRLVAAASRWGWRDLRAINLW